MNLLQRLNPEVLQAMNADAEQYPNLIASLKRELQAEIYSPLNLSVNDASYICHYNNNKILNIINLFDCFNKE